MNKITALLISLISFTLSIWVLADLPSKTVAQMGGSNSQEPSNESNQEIEQQEPKLEGIEPQEPTREQEEEKLEQTLDIQEKDPEAPKIEDLPAPGVGDNVPTPPPLGEREIKLPE